ncbi:MAG TPA: hypothetical protein VF545_13315 [Thermoleophilaceae bacterium]|jgi:hypothetical protein
MEATSAADAAPPPAGAPGPIPLDARTRALEFQCRLEDELATRVEPTDWGAAVFRDDLPRVADLNLLRVSEPLGGMDAAALMDEAENLQAGLPHRSIRVEDEHAGEWLARDFAAGGWTVTRTALMVLRRMPDRPIDTTGVTEVDLDRLRPARDAAIKRRHRDLDVAAQVLEAGVLPHPELGATALCAEVGSEVAAYCLIRASDTVAKLTEVSALERAHGRGVGLATVVAAGANARRRARPGAMLVFVESEPDEWAKAIYRRLGFDERGAMYRFVRRWGDEGALPLI